MIWPLPPALLGAAGTTTATWASDATPAVPAAASGLFTLNFNDGVGCAGHNQGQAVSSATFDGTGKSKLTLTLKNWFDGRPENGVDVRIIKASADGFATVPGSEPLDNTADQQIWQPVLVEQKAMAGKHFQVRLRFDNVTVQPKPGCLGWFVDDLSISGE